MDNDSDKKGSFAERVGSLFKGGTRPKFLGGKTEGGDAPAGTSKTENQGLAANSLKSAESSATGASLYKKDDSMMGALAREKEAGGLYSGGKILGKGKNKKGFKAFFKKRAPLLLIFGGLLGVGGGMLGTQMFQPFSLIAQFEESFNSMHVSANVRSNTFFKMQMDNGRVKNPIKHKVFSSDTFKISNKQKSKLAAQGIEYDEDFEGTGVRVLKFDDGSGEIKIVVADSADTGKVNARIAELGDSASVKYGASAEDFKTKYATDSDFFNGFNKASATWRGKVANWFGNMTVKFLQSNNLTRNMFQDFQKKVAATNDGNTKSAAQDIISEHTRNVEDGGVAVKDVDQYDEDGKGGEVPDSRKGAGMEDVVANGPNATDDAGKGYDTQDGQTQSPTKSSVEPTGMTADSVRVKLNDIAGKVQKGANIACTIMNTIGAVTLLVTAAEALQIINLTTAYFESVDKTKAGYGEETPIHDLTNALNDKLESKHTVIERTDTAWNENDQDAMFQEDGLQTIESKEVSSGKKSAMQAEGVSALYSGGKVNTEDPSVQSFNFTGSIKRIAGGIGVSMESFTGCAIAKLAANVVSGVTDAILIAGCILGAIGAPFTLGISASACAGLVGKIVAGVALSVAIGVAVGAVIASITPSISKMLTRDLVSNLGGEDLGNALTSGANMYQGNAHRANGGSLATISEYKEFAIAQKQVIAENAKYERQTLSPFDLTSKNTFLGTIMTQLMSFLTVDSFMSSITTSSSVVSSSIAAMSPTATAYDIASTLPDDIDKYEKTCPYLASIGAVGDAYCNPYSITDMSTTGVKHDPSDIIDILDGYDSEHSEDPAPSNFEENTTSDGNVIIKKDSGLAKYIIYCDNRESAFGIADNNIANSVGDFGTVDTGNSFFNNATNSAIGAIPVLGDAIDVISNKDQLENIGYVSGESCVAGNDIKGEYESNVTDTAERIDYYSNKSPDWSTAKYYQRFIEDQSLAESMGLIKESAVSVFLDEYYKENPLDNSYEGMLARKSGMTKDQVVALLELIEVGNYIANYDPSTRYAFGAPAVEKDDKIKFNNEYQLASAPILLNQITYADVRNRNYVV